ncbi:hypothetical protein CN285_28135 [Bacillus cereus]|nr:hypothetical protein [Bacillus paramycoides]PFD31293.1 hypothetical protein CN285_28135 [Bacillus cereus]PGM61791.1 hypothetical protein CN947_13230 [Bacillus cereus]
MGSSVSDKSLSHLATSSYGDAFTEVVEFGNKKEVWKPVEINGAVLHNSQNSFDATVYKNEETKQVVIAFRGSWEAPSARDADALALTSAKFVRVAI